MVRKSRNDLQTAQRKVVTQYSDLMKNQACKSVVHSVKNNWSTLSASMEALSRTGLSFSNLDKANERLPYNANILMHCDSSQDITMPKNLTGESSINDMTQMTRTFTFNMNE